MPDLPELTAAQARAAVETATRSVALTSGAGCGKTLVLARRFTTLLMAGAQAGENPFDHLVALTFTDKAAIEMLQRVRAVLLDALEKTPQPEDRRRLAQWITELPIASISTIHGFCASLLRRHAVEAGVDPDFEVCADELVAAQMLSESAETAVLTAVENGQTDVLELLARADLGRVVRDVEQLLARRIDWRQQDYAQPDETLDRWRRRQQELRAEQLRRLTDDAEVRAELGYVSGFPCTDRRDRLALYRYDKLRVIERVLGDPAKARAEDFAALADSPGNVGGQKAWGGKEALMAFRHRLKEFVARFAACGVWFEPLAEADADAARVLSALTRLAAAANVLYARAKRAAGMLDFDDLIDLTARLLRDDPAVRDALARRVSQLLIDECQDTDAHQLRMLWDLLARDDRPPPGKLFVVGDLKQSIYRFRGARAEEFTNLCRRFGDDRIALDESFRTHAAGVAFVNRVFAELMGPDYTPIRSKRSETPPGASVEILLAECGEHPTADSAAAAQADVAAERIDWMIGRRKLVWDRQASAWREVRAGDVAILFARMTKSLEYERALQQRGVPYYVVAGTGFFQQQEVYDVLNALRVIDNPFDDVALAGVLRSAVFGLDDNVLLHLAESASPPYFDKLDRPAVLRRLSAPQRKQLLFASGLLAGLHRVKDALGPAGLIERLLAETGYAATLLSQFGGRRKLGNVRQLLAAARSAQQAGGVTLADFVRRYGELVLAQWRYEQAAVAAETEDVVRIMTIHKAKGLEFPVVVVPDLNAGFRGPGHGLLFRHDWGLTCRPAPPAGEDAEDRPDDPVSHRLSRQAEKEALAAEDARKLYVAVTRHADHLVLVGADRRDKDGGFLDRTSYLAQLDAVLGIAAAVDAGRERIHYDPEHYAEVARIKPSAPARPGARRPAGRRIMEAASDPEQAASALARSGKDGELPLVGPLPPPAGGATGGTVAATALADFEHCPMLYRWRHELRVPAWPQAGGSGGAPASPLDAATAGSVFHRCMELLDFDADDLPAQAEQLLRRALAEMEPAPPPGGLATELAAMLGRLADDPLLASIRRGRDRLRELPLVLRAGGVDIAGQIDLLYRDAGGAWVVVDYKSDRVDPHEVPARARRYALQMLIYLTAARRHLRAEVAAGTLYFLRPGVWHRFEAGEAGEPDLERRLADLAGELLASRRAGRFARRRGPACRGCPYAVLCRPGRG